MVLIAEENVGGGGLGDSFSGISQAETSLLQALTERGVSCLDSETARAGLDRQSAAQALGGSSQALAAIARGAGAELVLLGKAAAVNQGYVRDSRLVAVAANLNARLVSVSSSEVLAAVSERAVMTHLDAVTAGGMAIDKAARAAAEKLSPFLLRTAPGSAPANVIELLVTGLESLAEVKLIEKALEDLGATEVEARDFDVERTRLDVRAPGGSQWLGRAVDGAAFGGMRLTVVRVSSQAVEARASRER
jgi:hypothetical protein